MFTWLDMEPVKKILPYDRIDRKIVELCREGQYLEAVKVCKEEKGLGLKEAKDHVDSLAAEYGIQRKSAGCFGLLSLLLILLIIYCS